MTSIVSSFKHILKAGYKAGYRDSIKKEISRRVYQEYNNMPYTVITYENMYGQEFEEVLDGVVPGPKKEVSRKVSMGIDGAFVTTIVYEDENGERFSEILSGEVSESISSYNNTLENKPLNNKDVNPVVNKSSCDHTQNKNIPEYNTSASIIATTSIFMGNTVFDLPSQDINDMTFKILSWCESGSYDDIVVYDSILTRIMLLTSMELINIEYNIVIESMTKGIRILIANIKDERKFIYELKNINWDLRTAAANYISTIKTELILVEPMSYKFDNYNFAQMDLDHIITYILNSDAKTNLSLVEKISIIAKNSEKSLTKLFWAKLVGSLNQSKSLSVKYSIRTIINCLNIETV